MTLIGDVRRLCDRLARGGWTGLLRAHGLDIRRDLRSQLRKTLDVKRGMPGFEDFSADGCRGIEPGQPARSLLYHALASTGVTHDDEGAPLTVFPTLAELDVVENLIFASSRASLATLARQAKDGALAVVVFAYEYRPASQTCHQRHADLVFSRTGIARVGTKPARYVPFLRGFVPYDETDGKALRVSPARYAAFIAARSTGNKEEFCPMGHLRGTRQARGDDRRDFWLPLHKLFDGDECLAGKSLAITYDARHVNEKIRRVHLELERNASPHTQVSLIEQDAKYDEPPFRIRSGIARLSRSAADGPGVLHPIPHPRLVAPAKHRGRRATYRVPKPSGKTIGTISGTLALESIVYKDIYVRHAPEYVHARTKVKNDAEIDLAKRGGDIDEEVRRGRYDALHYVDFTADGYVHATCDGLAPAGSRGVAAMLGRVRPAYSLVTAPDFFFRVDQRELVRFTKTLPKRLAQHVWSDDDLPAPLSETRIAANVQLPDSPFGDDPAFDPADDTMTAVVSLFGPAPRSGRSSLQIENLRHSHLPDDAAGVFAPGWDVSVDAGKMDRTLNKYVSDRAKKGLKLHLAAYGLGSPFPEDAKLCASLSTFWPAAAPDATRQFAYGPSQGALTTCPLTDDECGMPGGISWDGSPAPRRDDRGSISHAVFKQFAKIDYVRNELNGRFTFSTMARINAAEYERRILAMQMAYAAVGARALKTKARWITWSFRVVQPGDDELADAERGARSLMLNPAFRFEMFRCARKGQHVQGLDSLPGGTRLPMYEETIVFVDTVNLHILARRKDQSRWRSRSFVE